MIPELLGILCGLCNQLYENTLPDETENATEGGDTFMTPELLKVLREISDQLGRIADILSSMNTRL